MNSNTKSLDEFYELTDAEDYFEFFDLDYDSNLIDVKRFHILKEYGTLIKTGFSNLAEQEEQLLDFLKYSLLKVYGRFTNGYAPSAADIWGMFKDGKLSGCMACIPQPGNSCGC
ncbi:nitrogenase-stabilizing/protective protein NifW [Candidatus Sulfurimonas baltica]|uniref:Nitrogenase-stabilizing/protective protein NifW n=1 Tax=Candidatus Sulfurimonas baltica TaxID=2740404 RepID=A0A7S7LXF1_9BACT|nr:nitrogenase-stabilizing/protective protein NifW [Candidatus Sulfurimonas baltica]QOY53136.1 nitrogen fixation protein NifW [Candidatus Sulfurimonas baltica]